MTSIARMLDCMIGMSEIPNKHFDIAIVDPQYGIGESRRVQSRGISVKQKNGRRLYISSGRKHAVKNWDDERPGKDYFNELIRVSKNQIIFGGNHFADLLPASSGWIVWDKVNYASDQSDCELIWTSFKRGCRKVEFMWNGFQQGRSIAEGRIAQGNKKLNEKKIHPTQKPVALYKWLLREYASDCHSVIDTHLGSGSSRIACYDAGKEFLGFEIDQDYFTGQENRFRDHIAQLPISYVV